MGFILLRTVVCCVDSAVKNVQMDQTATNACLDSFYKAMVLALAAVR